MIHWVFDTIIFCFLLSTEVLLIELFFQEKQKKNRKRRVAFLFLSLAWLIVFYGSFVEPRMLVINHQQIFLSHQETKPLRVAVVSDFHLGPYKSVSWVQKVVKKINTLEPDAVFLLGDFIYADGEEIEALFPLKDLQARLGVYAVLGNHDYKNEAQDQVLAFFEHQHIPVLQNMSVPVSFEGKDFQLVGVNDLWYDGDVFAAFAKIDKTLSTLLLSHNPDVVLYASAAWADLVISAHTHGGQIRLPFLGSLRRVPTLLGRAYEEGWFSFWGHQQLLITSGVGESGPRARLFNPPEILFLDIFF